MKGTVLDYNIQNNEGYVSGDDGQRYTFSGADWKSPGVPRKGQKIDFTTVDDKAHDIFAMSGLNSSVGGKNKITAALLALFLGHWGVHKFYLGYNKEGVIMLLCGTVGIPLLFIPLFIVRVIAFIEFIIYLTKSDDEFENIYVNNKKKWF